MQTMQPVFSMSNAVDKQWVFAPGRWKISNETMSPQKRYPQSLICHPYLQQLCISVYFRRNEILEHDKQFVLVYIPGTDSRSILAPSELLSA